MENLKWALSLQEPSPQVHALLQCLDDVAFDLDVYICSVGGVGSTELSNFLTRNGLRCNLLTDQDAFRHTSTPPARLGCSSTRVIYLFGDPLASVASHYRRGHAQHQALKTSNNSRLAGCEFPETFEDYMARSDDLFGYSQHLDNWLTKPISYDVLFVRYERMFDREVAQALLRHAFSGAGKTDEDVSEMVAAWCASKRERKSRVTEEQRARMYVDLVRKMDGLPAVFMRKAGSDEVVGLTETRLNL